MASFYNKRPSVWVEPKAHWGAGQVMLVEIPALDETFDNIVAFWNPAEKPQKGQELLFGYKLYWCREIPVSSGLATARATRTGIGGIVGQKRTHFSWRFVVDFAGGDLACWDWASMSRRAGDLGLARQDRDCLRPAVARDQWLARDVRSAFDG